jgi:hypothetical protein
MTLLAPNVGVQEILKRALNFSATGDVKLHLFQNDYTPVEGSTVANLTEATWTGYAIKTLTGASWTVTNADPSEASYAIQTFTSSAGSQNQANYGYYITDSANSILLWAERFTDGPYTIVNNGDTISVTPKITLD